MLERILTDVRRRIPHLVEDEPEIRAAGERQAPVKDFAAAIKAPGLSVIAEVKRASPSRGLLDDGLDPAELASRYQAGGAAAISVLTEPEHFRGSLEDLRSVRARVSVPVLRKDFILHPVQVWEGRAAGADALLLIVAVLDDQTLHGLLAETRLAGMAALVEVHTAEEAKRAVAAGATVVGVNNRNLRSFAVDLRTAESIAPLLEGVPVRVAESGISSRGDAVRMARAGYHGVLVGESLVRADDPAALVAELRGAR